MHVLIDDRRDCLVELELERDPVLDVVLVEGQEIVGLRSSRLDQVLAKANAGKVTQPDRRHRQDRHRDRDLGEHRGPDGRVPLLQASLPQELLR